MKSLHRQSVLCRQLTLPSARGRVVFVAVRPFPARLCRLRGRVQRDVAPVAQHPDPGVVADLVLPDRARGLPGCEMHGVAGVQLHGHRPARDIGDMNGHENPFPKECEWAVTRWAFQAVPCRRIGGEHQPNGQGGVGVPTPRRPRDSNRAGVIRGSGPDRGTDFGYHGRGGDHPGQLIAVVPGESTS